MQASNMRLASKNYPVMLNSQDKEQAATIHLSRASSIGATSMIPTLPTASMPPPPSSLSSVLSTLTIHSDNSNIKTNLSDSGSHRSRTEKKYKLKSKL